ncbi:MAG: transketolase [Bacteroidales bacterium]|nr:transketolase [Bacteroidales bacterium]
MTTNTEELKRISTQVRRDIIRMVTAAKSGHPGGSMSSADFLTALFFSVMKHDPETWRRDAKGHDAFILSAGHLTPVYYSLLSRAGYFPASELGTFRKIHSRLQGHPSVQEELPGITQCSGSLGQGLSAAAGIALGKKMDKDGNLVYTMLGDGESEEGQIWEAAIFAAHHKIDNLIAITDWNNQQIDGEVAAVGGMGDLAEKWSAFGWAVVICEDGHDFEKILKTFEIAKSLAGEGKPVMVLMKTDMGHGVDFMAGTCKWHGKAPNEEQRAAALAQLEETLGDY